MAMKQFVSRHVVYPQLNDFRRRHGDTDSRGLQAVEAHHSLYGDWNRLALQTATTWPGCEVRPHLHHLVRTAVFVASTAWDYPLCWARSRPISRHRQRRL